MRQETLVQRYGRETVAQAAKLILAGQPVAVPTETVYGLAADATNAAAVARVYEAKGRPSFNPLIVHVGDLEAAEGLAEFHEPARELATRHWPGPLTLVLPRRPHAGLADAVTAGLPTVALRVPAHRAMQALLASVGRPLAAPSANASGRISPTTAQHVCRSLNGRIALVIDDGPCAVGLESSIVGFDQGAPVVLRPGAIEIAASAPVAGPVTAPGQLPAHYAPSKPLRIDAATRREDEWYIGFGESAAPDASLSATGDLREAAAALYEELHKADASDRARIAVAPVPRKGLGLAINDRLRRAAFESSRSG